MLDGIKILDLWVSVAALLTNDRLLFPLALDEQTGAVLNRPRRADDQGLTFSLIPRQSGRAASGRADVSGCRVELSGSIHRYGRAGLHNADQFTVADLLAALDQLVTTYGIDPFTSRLNGVEFGVNVWLPFPVSHVLDNLIGYKNRPFTKEPGRGFSYYQAMTQRYVVKLYDKGDQYGLSGNVLRVEVKVLKMEYLTRRSVRLDTLADLLLTDNYGALGALLVDTFTEILFDEPTISPAGLTTKERDIYQNGRNPRFWSIPDDLTGKEYDRRQKSFKRAETKFRALLDQHRQGDDWQRLTAVLIGQTWQRLSTVDDDLLTRISERRAAWADLTVDHHKTVMEPTAKRELIGNLQSVAGRETVEKCPLLTGSDDDLLKGKMSGINPLSIVLIPDNEGSQTTDRSGGRGTPEPGGIVCPVTGVKLDNPKPGQRFVTAAMLRNDDDLLIRVKSMFGQYAKGSKEDEYSRAAHNARNAFHNEPNNLRRRINRINRQPTLFDVSGMVRLTPDQRAALNHWQGTRYEVRW